jgi:thiol-disulfide isomerase/thioredoxin
MATKQDPRRLSASLAAAVLVLAAVALAAPKARAGSGSCETKPFIVKIHADWCGTCKRLGPVWEEIQATLGEQATVVNLDVTDRAAYDRSRAEAERLGIDTFVDEYRARTGAIAVLDCRTREPVVVLLGERDITKYRDALARAGRTS